MQPKIQVKVRCNITVSNLGLWVASILLWQFVQTLLNEHYSIDLFNPRRAPFKRL